MARRTSRLTALAAAALLLGSTAATLSGSAAADKKWEKWDQSLQGTDGTRILATFDGKDYKAVVVVTGAKKAAPLRDGEYPLANGGAIRVKGGKIIWDGFGVIEKVKRDGSVKIVPMLG